MLAEYKLGHVNLEGAEKSGEILRIERFNNRKADDKRIELNLNKNLKNECKYKFNKLGRKIYY